MYLRLKSKVGYEITVEEAREIARAINADAKFFAVRGNMISSSEVSGIYQDAVGKDFVARDRGLIKHGSEYSTAEELLGRSPVLPQLPHAPKVEDVEQLEVGNA